MAIPLITPNSQDFPTLGQVEATFESNMNNMLGVFFPQFETEFNASVTETNLVFTSINTTKTDIDLKSAEVEANALIAQSAANYKGDWVANYNITGYSLADSVTYTDGKNYVSKVDTNLVEPTLGAETAE